MADSRPTIILDGENLTPENLVDVSTGNFQVALSPAAIERISLGRAVVDEIVEQGDVVYGINTGFGNFANVVIPPSKLSELQFNLIRSHAAGIGEPLPQARTRMLLALRINVLCKGHSGIRLDSVVKMVSALNKNCISVVPARGTVGASGDLAPLSHLALGLLGEGPMWRPDGSGIGLASEILAANGIEPLALEAKEGLAMINGTQLITSLGAEAVVRARRLLPVADVATAMTLETLKGSVRAFHPNIHEVRPHRGQIACAARLRALLHSPAHPSEIAMSHVNCGRVQDSYTMRCSPQVHGVCADMLEWVYSTLSTEMNSATDNPMVFRGDDHIPDSHPSSHRAHEHFSACEECQRQEAVMRCGDCVESTLFCKHCFQRLHFSAKRRKHKPTLLNAGHGFSSGEVSHTHYIDAGAEGAGGATEHDHRHRMTSSGTSRSGFIISGGNFHGEYPAKACDMLAIAISEIASISERRIERLVNPQLSELPAFLLPPGAGGLHSGFMIAHCTAAALVSENKVLVHPASCDSISTSAAKEDHVSMGGFAARKALTVVEHVEMVVAIELAAACQALDLLRPLTTTPALEAVHALVRTKVAKWDGDRHMSPDLEAVAELIRSGAVYEVARPFLVEAEQQREEVSDSGSAARSPSASSVRSDPRSELQRLHQVHDHGHDHGHDYYARGGQQPQLVAGAVVEVTENTAGVPSNAQASLGWNLSA